MSVRRNIVLNLFRRFPSVIVLLVGGLGVHGSVLAAVVIFTPERLPTGPIGIFISVDYNPLPSPEIINFSEKQVGTDWRSVVSNYYYIVQNQNEAEFIDLHTERDGARAYAEEHAAALLLMGSDVEISNVELSGMFRVGQLIVPLVRSEISPRVAGQLPIILCYDDECFKTFGRWKRQFGDFYRSIDGKYAKFLRQLDDAEAQAFESSRSTLQRYFLTSDNPEHLTPDNEDLYPNVFLDLKNYFSRISYGLVDPSVGDISADTPPELVPVLKLFKSLHALDDASLNDKEKLALVFDNAFDNSKIKKSVLPVFSLEKQDYQNNATRLGPYAGMVRQWDAIIPVGYLDQGDVRYVFFYPVTQFGPLDGNGEGIIQMLPVIKSEGEFKMSYNGLPFTSLSSLQFPEAIELYLSYFDRNQAPTPPAQTDAAADDTPRLSEDGPPPGDKVSSLYFVVAAILVLVLAVAFLWLRNARARGG